MVSSATCTAIRMEDAPKGMVTLAALQTKVGIVASTARNRAANSVSRLLVLFRNWVVGTPERTPGMWPPCCWTFLEMSSALKVMAV